MAYSKPVTGTTAEALVSLTDCGICLSEMEHPKALPCLHSFCLNCLKKVKHPPGIFICPLCQEKITLPPGGVDGFRNNFYINQLKDRRAIQKIGEVKMPCICCKSIDRETIARCVDCNGFLCQQCVDLHTTLTPLIGHKVFTIDELKSGQIDMSKVMKDECCQKHKDQVLRWFCKTCGIPICRDCTVMEHRHPDHHYVTIESITEGQINEIKTLMANCKGLSQNVTDAIVNTEEVQNNLNKAADEVKRQLDKEKKDYLEAIESSYKANMDKLAQIQREKSEKIDATKKDLQNIQSKLTNAMEIANEVTQSGSKHDVASNYSTLCKTLTQLRNSKPSCISKSFGVVTFRPSQKGKEKTVDIGSVTKGARKRYGNGKWVLEKEIGKQGETTNAHSIAVSPSKEFLIADIGDPSIKIFNHDGKLKQVIKNNLSQPNDIALSSSGFFVTDRTAFIKTFSLDGKYVKQFPAISPDGKASDTDGSELYGLAIDNEGNLLAGNYSKYYISKHRPDGTHVSSFPIDIHPHFLKVTSNGSIVVSSFAGNAPVNILDRTGKLLHNINKPKDTAYWYPSGPCCSDDGIIYVASYEPGGIYSFTEEGAYLGCVTTGVTHAVGIAFYDYRLVVAQYGGLPAKMFTYKEE